MEYFALLIFLPLLFSTVYGQTAANCTLWHNLPGECGKTRFNDTVLEAMEDRIINGTEAKLGQFPWMARFGIRLGNSSIIFLCGGSLISRTFVILAAHCEERGDIVRLGQTYEPGGTQCDEKGDCAPPYQDIGIKNYIFGDFCRRSMREDVMLLELDTPAELNDFVQPICLPRTSMPLSSLVGEYIITAGWGLQNATDKASAPQKLMYIVVPVQNIKKCIPFYPDFDRYSQFCLSRPNDKSVCFGDSGSGAIKFVKINGERRAHLVGIASFTDLYCTFSPVFTSVGYHLDKILIQIDKYLNKNL